MADEPVIYRAEVLTMWLIGDLTLAMRRLVELVEGDDGEEADED